MRILYVAPPGALSNAHGGIETYARELIAGMRQRGHSVEVLVCDPGTLLAQLSWEDRVPRWRFRQRYYFWRRFHLQDYRYHNALARVTRKALRQFEPQLVHALHLYQLASLLEARSIPTVVSCYGLEVEDVPPVRASLERASAVHCDSDFTRALVRSVVGERPDVFTATWGIRDRDAPRPLNAPVDFELVTVGRLVKRKNVETILHALAVLNNPSIRYAVVGEGPEMEHLKALAVSLNLSSVRFLGALSSEEKRHVLQRSRVFVMCPRNDLGGDVEGLGLVYFEAHGLGLPCVGARSGGVPEAIGAAGILVERPDDRTEVAEAIRHALSPDGYRLLCLAVEERQRSHSWERFLSSWEHQYTQLLPATSH